MFTNFNKSLAFLPTCSGSQSHSTSHPKDWHCFGAVPPEGCHNAWDECSHHWISEWIWDILSQAAWEGKGAAVCISNNQQFGKGGQISDCTVANQPNSSALLCRWTVTFAQDSINLCHTCRMWNAQKIKNLDWKNWKNSWHSCCRARRRWAPPSYHFSSISCICDSHHLNCTCLSKSGLCVVDASKAQTFLLCLWTFIAMLLYCVRIFLTLVLCFFCFTGLFLFRNTSMLTLLQEPPPRNHPLGHISLST